MSNNNEDDIWCCCCGDRTYYAVLEERELGWYLKDETRGIGICIACSEVVDEKELTLPEDEKDKDDALKH